jgi:hypothetical protein
MQPPHALQNKLLIMTECGYAFGQSARAEGRILALLMAKMRQGFVVLM